MTYLDLGVAAETSALGAVTTGLTPFGVEQAKIAAFAATGNPDTDWPQFNQLHTQAVQRYTQLATRDRQAAGKSGKPAALPTALQTLISAKQAAAAPAAAAPAPATAATATAAAAPA